MSNKYNCRILLEQKLENHSLIANHSSSNESPQFTIEFPEGHVPLNSRFYIARANLESTCYGEISQPGAFLRLKAPRKMGKTSLATRIMAYGNTQSYKTAYLSLEQVETEIFSSIGKFLRWLCINIARQWGIASKLDEYWDEDMGALVSCSVYLQSYLLKQLSHPGILIFDEVDRVFEYPHIAHDLYYLLWNLKHDRDLWSGFQQVLKSSTKLEPEAEFKLASLGLVTLNDNEARVSCGLYQQYFSQVSLT